MPDLDSFLADLDAAAGDAAALHVDADLRLQVTTTAGAVTTAQVTGQGHEVRVQAQRPEVLLSAVDRADIGRLADLLAGTGVTVAVSGPHGPVATLGAAASSRWGRAVTGSARVAPVPRAALRLAVGTRAARVSVLGLVAGSVALVTIRRLLRTNRSGPMHPGR